jgi:hypothetical protein
LIHSFKTRFTTSSVNYGLMLKFSVLSYYSHNHGDETTATSNVSDTAMLKSLFKRSQQTPDELQALLDSNIALRVRMDKIIHFEKPKQFSNAPKSARLRTAIAA